ERLAKQPFAIVPLEFRLAPRVRLAVLRQGKDASEFFLENVAEGFWLHGSASSGFHGKGGSSWRLSELQLQPFGLSIATQILGVFDIELDDDPADADTDGALEGAAQADAAGRHAHHPHRTSYVVDTGRHLDPAEFLGQGISGVAVGDVDHFDLGTD